MKYIPWIVAALAIATAGVAWQMPTATTSKNSPALVASSAEAAPTDAVAVSAMEAESGNHLSAPKQARKVPKGQWSKKAYERTLVEEKAYTRHRVELAQARLAKLDAMSAADWETEHQKRVARYEKMKNRPKKDCVQVAPGSDAVSEDAAQ